MIFVAMFPVLWQQDFHPAPTGSDAGSVTSLSDITGAISRPPIPLVRITPAVTPHLNKVWLR